MRILEKFQVLRLGEEELPKVVFLHGLMGYANNWKRIMKALSTQFHVLAYDQRGHGKSFQPESGYAPEDYAADLLMILDHLNWQKIHLVGHSMGGRVALSFAASHPNRLNKLCIEDIGPDVSLSRKNEIEHILRKANAPFESRKQAKEHLERLFDPVLSAYLYANLEEKRDARLDWKFSETAILLSTKAIHEKERWSEVEALSMPCLWVRGADSDTLSQEVFERVLATNPKIKGALIEKAGHWVHYDQPEVFTNQLFDFLRD